MQEPQEAEQSDPDKGAVTRSATDELQLQVASSLA
jgi:hypothetical protein